MRGFAGSQDSRRVFSAKWLSLVSILAAAACSDSVTGPREGQVRPGSWGGPSAGLQVTQIGAMSAFPCGAGTVTQPMRLDGGGRFDAAGTIYFKLPPAGPACYSGRVDGDRMTLTVRVEDRALGPFTLTLGEPLPSLICR